MASTLTSPLQEVETELFQWPEYLVFGTVLACSVGIGVFFGCFGTKNATNAEYLHGNKRMHPVPVALSLLCSYVSSITLLGHPVEIYLYGIQYVLALLCYIPVTLSLIYFYVPFYFNLQLTSVYEYLELRFSRSSRYLLSSVNLLYSIFYMALVVYGPALALSQVTGVSHHMLVALMFTVCIFYSAIGGIKAVLWTDSLQALIMISSMATVVFMGISNVGGFSVILERAEKSGRLNLFNFDPDPRTRHTVWTALIGGYFSWLPMYLNQAQVQRYISLPSINAVKIALVINLFGLWIIMGLCYLAGLVIYATYYNCDPLTNGEIQEVDQLLPKLVMDTFGDFPGLPGLFVAGITCAALSTVSSVVNAMAATVTEDYVKQFKSDISERKLALIAKIISAVTGLAGFGFAFLAESMGSIFSAATTLLGIFGGPTIGIFIAGMFFPWANSWGAISGMILTFVFMAFLGFGSRQNQAHLPVQVLELDVSGCQKETPFPSASPATTSSPTTPLHWKDEEYSDLVKFFSISDLWYPALGTIMTVFLALVFSLFVTHVMKRESAPVKSNLFIPLILKMWRKLCPNQLERFVILDENEGCENSTLQKIVTGKAESEIKENYFHEISFRSSNPESPDSIVKIRESSDGFVELCK